MASELPGYKQPKEWSKKSSEKEEAARDKKTRKKTIKDENDWNQCKVQRNFIEEEKIISKGQFHGNLDSNIEIN